MISPQGYKLGEDPKSKNPFWEGGEDSNVNKIFATATVDDGTGVPSVTTSKTVSGSDITFGFDFHNLKGKEGDPGKSGFSPSARVEQTETGATITVTDKSGTTTASVENGTPGKSGFSPSARVEQTETGATITVTDKSGTTTATVNNGAPGKGGDPGPAGPGVPVGGTAGQVLAKKSGTDYDTEWVNQSGGSSGYVTFGGKTGMTYEPRLEENLYKTSQDFSRNINESSSVTYFLNGAPVDDTINISGVLNIPAGTLMEKTLSYFIGGFTAVSTDTQKADKQLNTSDFTITLSSGNTIEITSLSISNIGSSSPVDSQSALITAYFNVIQGTESAFGSVTINIGLLNIMGQSELNTYHLEPKK